MDVYEQLMIKVMLEGTIMENCNNDIMRNTLYQKLLKHLKDNYIITTNHDLTER